MRMDFDTGGTIVLETGTSTIKAGYHIDKEPTEIFPTVIGTKMAASHSVKKCDIVLTS